MKEISSTSSFSCNNDTNTNCCSDIESSKENPDVVVTPRAHNVTLTLTSYPEFNFQIPTFPFLAPIPLMPSLNPKP